MSDTRTFRVVDEDGDYYEITGDPTDALNAAYRERAHLVALLAAVYPSHIGRTDPAAPDWTVATLQLPTGQAAWHIAADDEDLFQHVEHDPEHAFEYDGHSTEEKYQRIRTLTAEIAAVQEATEPDVMAVPVAEVRRATQDERDGDARAVARTVWMYGTDEHSSEHAYTTIEAAQTEAIWEYDATLAEYPEYWSWEPCPPQDGRLAMLCGDDRTGYTVFPVTIVEQHGAALDARNAKVGE